MSHLHLKMSDRRSSTKQQLKLPSFKDLMQLEGLDWTRVILTKRTCDDCGGDFGTKGELEAHHPCIDKKLIIVDADGNKRYKCTICSFVARDATVLQHHLNHHYDERTWKCNHCNISPFVQRGSLFRHLHYVHYSKPCPVRSCEKLFASRQLMMQHSIEAHDIRLKECTACGILCSDADILRAHVKRLHRV